MAVMLELAGALVSANGMCWDPWPQHWDMLDSTAPALGHIGIHGLYIEACWGPSPWHWDILGAQLQHWDLLGPTAFILELAGALVAGTGTCWDTRAQPWDTLGPTTQRLGRTGTRALSAGTCCAPSTGTTSPRWPPRGSGAAASRGRSPFMYGSGCLQSAAPPLPPPPLPPDKPRGRDSVSWAVWRISRLFIGVWDTLATLRTNLSHPPRSLPGTSSHSCATLSAP